MRGSLFLERRLTLDGGWRWRAGDGEEVLASTSGKFRTVEDTSKRLFEKVREIRPLKNGFYRYVTTSTVVKKPHEKDPEYVAIRQSTKVHGANCRKS